jgi:hypothetical protein
MRHERKRNVLRNGHLCICRRTDLPAQGLKFCCLLNTLLCLCLGQGCRFCGQLLAQPVECYFVRLLGPNALGVGAHLVFCLLALLTRGFLLALRWAWLFPIPLAWLFEACEQFGFVATARNAMSRAFSCVHDCLPVLVEVRARASACGEGPHGLGLCLEQRLQFQDRPLPWTSSEVSSRMEASLRLMKS